MTFSSASEAGKELHALSRERQRQNTQARNALIRAARKRFGLSADTRTDEVLWRVAQWLESEAGQ